MSMLRQLFVRFIAWRERKRAAAFDALPVVLHVFFIGGGCLALVYAAPFHGFTTTFFDILDAHPELWGSVQGVGAIVSMALLLSIALLPTLFLMIIGTASTQALVRRVRGI